MKIENGKVIIENEGLEDIYLRNKLDEILKSWFDLKIEDLPEIMEKIGVRSKNYKIVLDPMSNIWKYSLIIETISTTYKVDIVRDGEKESNPEPYFKFCHNGKEKVYRIKRTIMVSGM